MYYLTPSTMTQLFIPKVQKPAVANRKVEFKFGKPVCNTTRIEASSSFGAKCFGSGMRCLGKFPMFLPFAYWRTQSCALIFMAKCCWHFISSFDSTFTNYLSIIVKRARRRTATNLKRINFLQNETAFCYMTFDWLRSKQIQQIGNTVSIKHDLGHLGLQRMPGHSGQFLMYNIISNQFSSQLEIQ